MLDQSSSCPSAASVAFSDNTGPRSAVPAGLDDEERLTADVTELARQYGRYGYRKIA